VLVLFLPHAVQFCANKTLPNKITKMDQQIAGKPSKQVEEVGNWWVKIVAASTKHESLEAARDFGENWTGLTAEPGGVDYIETDAGGVPAMWAVPKGGREDRVIVCLHGGGFSAARCIRTGNFLAILPRLSAVGP
jgi:acetyl esterase/lipase